MNKVSTNCGLITKVIPNEIVIPNLKQVLQVHIEICVNCNMKKILRAPHIFRFTIDFLYHASLGA